MTIPIKPTIEKKKEPAMMLVRTKDVPVTNVSPSLSVMEKLEKMMEKHPSIQSIIGALFNMKVKFPHDIVNENHVFDPVFEALNAEKAFKLQMFEDIEPIIQEMIHEMKWEKECWSVQVSLNESQTIFFQYTWMGNVINLDGSIFPLEPPRKK